MLIGSLTVFQTAHHGETEAEAEAEGVAGAEEVGLLSYRSRSFGGCSIVSEVFNIILG